MWLNEVIRLKPFVMTMREVIDIQNPARDTPRRLACRNQIWQTFISVPATTVRVDQANDLSETEYAHSDAGSFGGDGTMRSATYVDFVDQGEGCFGMTLEMA